MISIEEILKIAKLAHLNLSEDEQARMTAELSSILDYIDQLNKVDVSGVEPMSHVHGSNNVMREDLIAEPLPFEELKKIAPDSSGRFIRVPIIVE